VHVAELVAPSVAEYVPAAHCVHVDEAIAPTAVEKLPACSRNVESGSSSWTGSETLPRRSHMS
jgi:hypothetical protein